MSDATPITVAELASLLAGADENARRQIAEALQPFMYDASRVYNDVRDDRKIRWLDDGADVTVDDAGAAIKYAGESYFDVANVRGGSMSIESRSKGRQININTGAGLLCYDAIVSTCWGDEVAAGRGVEGQEFTLATGCIVRLYSTMQGALDQVSRKNGYTDWGHQIGVCPGIYEENIVIDADNWGCHVEAIAGRDTAIDNTFGFSIPPVRVIPATGAAIALTTGPAVSGQELTFTGIEFRGISAAAMTITHDQGVAGLTFRRCRLNVFGVASGTIVLDGAGIGIAWDDCLIEGDVVGAQNNADFMSGSIYFRRTSITGDIRNECEGGGNALTLEGCTVSGYVHWGGFAGTSGAVTIRDSTISGPASSWGVVAVYVAPGAFYGMSPITIKNSMIGAIDGWAGGDIGIGVWFGTDYTYGTTEYEEVDLTIHNVQFPAGNAATTLLYFDGIRVGASSWICGIQARYHTRTNAGASVAPTFMVLDTGATIAPGAVICQPSGGATVTPGTVTTGSRINDADNTTWVDTADSAELISFGTNSVERAFIDEFGLAPQLYAGYDDVTVATIAGGVITLATSFQLVDTEASAASDDLDTITPPNTALPYFAFIKPNNDARTVVIKHGTGNIYCMGGVDITLDERDKHALLVYDSTRDKWTAGLVGGFPERYSIAEYIFIPDAAPGAPLVTGSQQGVILHSGPADETAIKFQMDCETAPGSPIGLTVTVQFGDTDDLDTVSAWTDIVARSLSGEKSNSTTSFTTSAIPADRLLRFNVNAINPSGSPRDLTCTLKVKRPLSV